MTNEDKVVIVAVTLGFVISTVGLTIALGTGWAALWAGLLLIAGALKFDSR